MSRSRQGLRIFVAMAGLTFLAPPVAPHGASRGFHLHLSPDPVAAGAIVTIRGNAPEKLVGVRVGLPGGPESETDVDPPSRRFAIDLAIPESWPEASASVHAEGRTAGGELLRASAIVRIETVVEGGPRPGRLPTQSAVRSLAVPWLP